MKMSNKYFLFFSCHAPDISISTIAGKMNISMSAMMKLLRELENKRYIRRVVSMEDHRIKYIEITYKGLELKEKMRALL